MAGASNWGAASDWRRKKAKAPKGFDPYAGTRMPNLGGYYADPMFGADADWGYDAKTGMIGGQPWESPTYTATQDIVYPSGGAGPGGGAININGQPDYRGILDKFTADWRAQLNTGLANLNASRLGNARALINRLGVRDPNAMLGKVGKYGLTLADLQQAADNPWSELKAIQKTADRARGQGEAGYAGRGTFRSGGTAGMYEDVENERARTEALASEEALRGLAQGEQQVADWRQQQEWQMMQRQADLEAQLASSYQPQTATWDDQNGGYRWGNRLYDQYGNLIRTL